MKAGPLQEPSVLRLCALSVICTFTISVEEAVVSRPIFFIHISGFSLHVIETQIRRPLFIPRYLCVSHSARCLFHILCSVCFCSLSDSSDGLRLRVTVLTPIAQNAVTSNSTYLLRRLLYRIQSSIGFEMDSRVD